MSPPTRRCAYALAALALGSGPALAQCEQRLVASTPAELADGFGESFDIDGDWVVVSARLDDEAAANAGAAWILERHAGQWSVDEKLVPQGSGPGALFTHARVAIEYPWAFAGSLWEQAPDGSGDRGVVRVYRHDPGTDQWQLTQSLWLEGAGASSSFGGRIEVDEGVLFVSARGSQELYVFRHDSTTDLWDATQILTDPEPGLGGNWLGPSIAAEGGDVATAVVRSNGEFVGYRFESVEVGLPHELFMLTDRVDFGGSAVTAGAVALGERGMAAQALMTVAGDQAEVRVHDRQPSGQVLLEALPAPDGLGAEFGRALAYDESEQLLFIGSRAFASGIGPLGLGMVYRRTGGGMRLESEFRAQPIYPELRFATSARSADGRFYVASQDDWGPSGSLSGRLHSYAPLPQPSLTPSDEEISVLAGGTQDLEIQACVEQAGHFYIVVGSFGLLPKNGYLQLGVHSLAIAPDAWTDVTLEAPNTGVLVGTFGVLDATGRATASIQIPPTADPSLIGLELHHAAVTIAPFNAAISSTSIPTSLLLGL